MRQNSTTIESGLLVLVKWILNERLNDLAGQRFEPKGLVADICVAVRLLKLLTFRIASFPVCLYESKLSPSTALAMIIVRFLEDAGPVYVKIGQVLSTRSSKVWHSLRQQLTRLQDNVRPLAPDIFRHHLLCSMSQSPESLFLQVDDVPLATGSIAQVHRATLQSGESVVIKLLRPNSYEEIVAALSLFRRVALLCAKLPGFRRSPVVESFDEIARAMLQQSDLKREAEMNAKLCEVYRDDARVKLPHVYKQYSNEAAIVMEFLPHLVKVTELKNPEWLEESLKSGFRTLFKMILDAGIIHCDFHAGNVFFSQNGRVTILDTGFMETFNPSEAYAFREFFLGIYRGDGENCARVLIETAASIGKKFHRRKFTEEITLLVRAHSRVAAAKFNVPGFSYRLFEIQRRNDLRGSHRFTLAIMSLLVFEGMAAEFVPDLDFQKEALAVLGPFLMWRAF